jgi:hypothetical protein
MSNSRIFAERACRFSQLSSVARSAEERESYLSIAQGYLRLAKQAAGAAGLEAEALEAFELQNS